METAAALILAFAAISAEGPGGSVEPIPDDWLPGDRARIPVAAAEASASFGAGYEPGRIHDGDRRTKWVSPVRPSAAAPQWVTLHLAGGVGEVSAVAVFGERIGNDGIVDAEIAVEDGGAFRAVAAVRDSKSPSWLASFDPARTGAVRLLVTRSSGPTDHTDVFEVEVYGRPLAPEEMEAHLAKRIEDLGEAAAEAERSIAALAPPGGAPPAALRRAGERLRAAADGLRGEAGRGGRRDGAARSAALGRAEEAARAAARLRERIRRAAEDGTPERREAFRTALEARRLLAPAGEAAWKVDGARGILSTEKIAATIDFGGGGWSAAWAEGTEAAILEARFSVEVDGRSLIEGQPETRDRIVEDDPFGRAREVLQVWRSGGLRVEREMRVFPGLGILVIGGRIANEGAAPARLGTVRLLDLGPGGGWWCGGPWEAPAAVFLQGESLLRSRPFDPDDRMEASDREYRSSGVLALAARDPAAALVIGHIRADEASPDVAARFRPGAGGTGLLAACRFLGRVLGPGETVELNRIHIAADPDPFRALEAFGDAMARASARPARRGPTGVWCSWYAHRMAMTEEKVLANAEVAARHLKPLGLEVIQLDHGWQQGDVTGDWTPNERFPHGLRWLAGELRRRHGLRLGLWISPTDVAATSVLFREHPDWMLRGDDGKPRVNWRWYWKPNPDCYEIDATRPEASRWIEETFRRLVGEGASYFKIDFIAAAGGEGFLQHDPKATRGWSNLRRAMEAVRAGAGGGAWIRFCQTPPVLSAGLADGAYGGGDTLDAGIPGRFDVLRDNALALAAGWWINDRPYHREVCDMSVRMQAPIEEVRLRAAIMALAGCTISWSDELCHLPPSRIRLQQQCMPPGGPPMRPLDIFERDVPSVWHIPVVREGERWDIVGLFNFEEAPEDRGVRFERLGLDPAAPHAVFEFWEERFLGVREGGVELRLPPQSSRVLSIRRATGAPQLAGTDLHILMGLHETKRIAWDGERGILSGTWRRAPGLRGKAFFLVPEGYSPRFDFPLSPESAHLTRVEGDLWMGEIEFRGAEVDWSIPFERR